MGEDVDVMTIDDVDAVEPQPLERELERAHHAVVTVIEAFPTRRRLEEPGLKRAFLGPAELQQPTDLGRDHKGVARLGAQESVQPRLGEPEAVDRRGVVVAAADRPGGVEGRARLLLRHRPVEVAERPSAEAEFGELQHRAGARRKIAFAPRARKFGLPHGFLRVDRTRFSSRLHFVIQSASRARQIAFVTIDCAKRRRFGACQSLASRHNRLNRRARGGPMDWGESDERADDDRRIHIDQLRHCRGRTRSPRCTRSTGSAAPAATSRRR